MANLEKLVEELSAQPQVDVAHAAVPARLEPQIESRERPPRDPVGLRIEP